MQLAQRTMVAYDHLDEPVKRADCLVHQGNNGGAINHLEAGLRIASSRDWHDKLCHIYRQLGMIFTDE